MTAAGPIEIAAFEAANSRAYLKAVFRAWSQGQCVMALAQGGGKKTVPGTKVLARESFAADPGWFDDTLPECLAGDRALIAFSSGTTGRPKAILLRHHALQDVVARINTVMDVDDTIREYLGVPVTYSFGFGRVRAVAAAGGRSFLPEHGFEPTEIGAMLASGEINAVSAVPTLWRVLLSNKETITAEAARNLKWIEIGSQWMTGAEKLELRHLFPNARIVQHYGLTEASRTALLDISEAPEERLDSVGRAVGEVEIAVDEDGRIRTRGPHIAEGLVSGAGVKPVVDEAGWLTTSDRGRTQDGWLYYEGRVDELINSGGLKIDPTAFEQAVNMALGVSGAVAAGRLADPIRGEKVLVALRRDAGVSRAAVTEAVRSEAARIGLMGNGSFELREVADLPLTATGKVRRAELANLPDLGARTLATTDSDVAKTVSNAGELQALWGEILGLETVPTDQSFYDLGGDSLSALAAVVKMQSFGIDAAIARGIFEGRTISQMAGEGAPTSQSKASSSDHRIAVLQALWREILGLDTVPTDRGFYDLGGDSLSALTAVMKMQSLGIDAETARGIFEGRTIAELAGEVAFDPDPHTIGKVLELKRLWGEILGLEAVPSDRSFYELGGDSLSALTAVMKMQSHGIDTELARGIFEGKTILDLAGEVVPDSDPVAVVRPVPTAPGAATATLRTGGPALTLAETVNSIHAARGVLVLWVVIVHWLPAFLGRIGEHTLWIYDALIPAWRLGTPGFAMVFGMGVGALGVHHYISNRTLFLKSSRFNTRLIVGGVLILAATNLAIVVVNGKFGERLAMSGLFYSAITYYALAMLTLPWLVWLITRGPNRLLTILAIGAGAALIHEVLRIYVAPLQPPALFEFLKIAISAKYGFFRMTSFVMIGVAIGWLFRQNHARPGVVYNMVQAGLVLIAFGAVGVVQAAMPLDEFGRSHLWHMSVYSGVTTLILAGFAMLSRAGGVQARLLNRFNAFAIASGILALPIFVGHEVVMRFKQLLDAVGVPDLLGLAVLLGLFFSALTMAYIRLMRFLR